MSEPSPLVSIGLPVRNGELRLPAVVDSVLGQDYPDLELVICDNASTDGTGELGRALARSDPRVVYHRQPADVGLLNNFITAIRRSRGRFFRWIGDGDTLAPQYVSRCLAEFAADDRRVLVTTQVAYLESSGTARTADYRGAGLGSTDPIERFREILRLLNQSYLLIDPLYGLIRREPVAAMRRVNMYCEDQVLAVRLALAGPWGHVPEVLARRLREPDTRSQVAAKLGVPRWQSRAAHALLCRDVLRYLAESGLDPAQCRQARAALAGFYAVRHRRIAARRWRRLTGYARRPVEPDASPHQPVTG
jgi:glycosyltransferase involved in cell wall biosynthesis